MRRHERMIREPHEDLTWPDFRYEEGGRVKLELTMWELPSVERKDPDTMIQEPNSVKFVMWELPSVAREEPKLMMWVPPSLLREETDSTEDEDAMKDEDVMAEDDPMDEDYVP